MSRHTTLVSGALAALLGAVAPSAAGQMGLPAPRVEVGFDAVAGTADHDGIATLAPRVTVNLSPRTSLSLRGDALVNRRGSPAWQESRTYGVILRHSLRHTDKYSLDAILGLGSGSTRTFVPVTGGTFDETTQGLLLYSGIGASQRMLGRVSLHEDIEFAAGSAAAGVTGRLGIGFPIGRYPMRRAGQQVHVATATLTTGDYVWVTDDDGTRVEGAVGDVTDTSIELLSQSGRTLVDMSRMQRIEIPDSLVNGAKRGALVGAIGGGLVSAVVGGNLCIGVCGSGEHALAFVAGTAYGIGLGALAGALLDSFNGNHTVVMDRAAGPRVAVAPLIGRQSLGLRAAVGW